MIVHQATAAPWINLLRMFTITRDMYWLTGWNPLIKLYGSPQSKRFVKQTNKQTKKLTNQLTNQTKEPAICEALGLCIRQDSLEEQKQ